MVRSVDKLLIFVFLMGLLGCGSEEPTDSKPAATPEQLITQFVEALAQNNQDELLTLVDGGESAHAFFITLLDTKRAAENFQERFVKTYGDEAWEAFQAPKPVDIRRADFTIQFPDIDDLRSRGGQWRSTSENMGQFDLGLDLLLHMHEVGGGWLIDTDSMFQSSQELEQSTALNQRMFELIKKHEQAIGHEGISAEDIDHQMGRDVMREIFGFTHQSDEPEGIDRYDVESLQIR